MSPSVTNAFFGIEIPGAGQCRSHLGVGLGEIDDDDRVGVTRHDVTGLGVIRRCLRVVDRLRSDFAALGLPGCGERVRESGAVRVVTGANVDDEALGSTELLLHEVSEGRSLERVRRCRPVQETVVVETGDLVAGRRRGDLEDLLVDRDRLSRRNGDT